MISLRFAADFLRSATVLGFGLVLSFEVRANLGEGFGKGIVDAETSTAVPTGRMFGHQLNLHYFSQEVSGFHLEYALPPLSESAFWRSSRLVLGYGLRDYPNTNEKGERVYLDAFDLGFGLRQFWFQFGPLVYQQQLLVGRTGYEDIEKKQGLSESKKKFFNFLDLRQSLTFVIEETALFTNFGVGLRSNFIPDEPTSAGLTVIPETSIYPFLDIGLRF